MAFRKKNLVGIDIGSDSLKAIMLKGMKGSEIDFITRFKLGCESQEDPLFESLASKGLKVISKQRGVSQSLCTSVITDPSVSFINLDLPPMPKDELKEAVKFEVKKELTYPISEAAIDYFIKDNPTTEKPTYTLTSVSVKKEAVIRQMNFLKDAGFKSAAIEIGTIPMIASFDFNHSWAPGKKTALLDIGTHRSHLLIVRDKTIRFYRDIPVAGSTFTDFFKNDNELSYQEADEMKLNLLSRKEDEKKNVDDVSISSEISSLFEQLALELQRSFDYYQARYREGPVGELILSGGGALIKDIDTRLQDILGMEVSIDNPFKKLFFSSKKDEEEFSKIAPLFTIAVGLALRKA